MNRSRAATEAVLAVGGKVTVSSQGKETPVAKAADLPAADLDVVEISLASAARPATKETFTAISGLPRLRRLDLGYNGSVTDELVSGLSDLPALEWLSFSFSPVTDRGVAVAARFPKLRYLELQSISVTDAGLKALENHPALAEIHINNPRVTDASSPVFASLPRLTLLNVWQSPISDAGLEQLAKAKSLRMLMLGPNAKVTAEGIAKLKAANPALTISGTPQKKDVGATPRPEPKSNDPVQGDDREQLKPLIDKAIEAAGGGKLKELKVWTLTLRIKTRDGLNVCRCYYELPNRFRQEDEVNSPNYKGSSTTVLNGNKGWEMHVQSGKNQVADLPPEHVKRTVERLPYHDIRRVLILSLPEYRLTALGESKIGETSVQGIELVREGERDGRTRMYFETTSGRLSKFEVIGKAGEKDPPLVHEYTFSDYRVVNGIPIAYKRVRKFPTGTGLVHEEEVVEFTTPARLDPKLFQRP